MLRHHSRRASALALLTCAAACGAAGTEATPGAPGESPASAPGDAPSSPPSGPATPDAPAVAPAAPTSRARCGAAAYDWVTTPALGDVLESRPLAHHSKIELSYVLLEARNKKAFKTRRLASHGTKGKVVRYQTQDRGKLVDATATVAYPDVSGPKTFPILVVLHGTVGFHDGCSPSGGIPDDILDSFTDETAVLLSLFASFGYIVVAPDYLGLKSMGPPSGFLHPYLVAEPTAIASLDAVRAAKKLVAGTSVTAGDVVVMGGSQGGHAAAFVNRYAPHYAPELTIKGSVWDVPPTDVMGQAVPALAAWTNATKNVIAATTALESWYGASPSGLGGAFLAPFSTAFPQALSTSCSPSSAFVGVTRETAFQPAFLQAGVQPGFGGYAPWACYMAENSLPTTSVPKLDSIPSLFLLGEQDDLVDNVVERASFQKLCAQGHALSYLECAGASHTKPLTYAFDQWIDFLEARLAGAPLTDVCTIKPAEACTSAP